MNEVFLKQGDYESRTHNYRKSQTQKHNWRKNRSKIMMGINRAVRKSAGKIDAKDKGVFSDRTYKRSRQDEHSMKSLIGELFDKELSLEDESGFSIEDIQGTTSEKPLGIDDIDKDGDLLDFEVYLANNLKDVELSNIISDRVEDSDDVYLDVFLKNGSVATLYFHMTQDNRPEIVIVSKYGTLSRYLSKDIVITPEDEGSNMDMQVPQENEEVPEEEVLQGEETESGYIPMDQIESQPEGSKIDFTKLSLIPVDFIKPVIKKLNDEYKAIVYRFNGSSFEKSERSQKDISLEKKHTLVSSDYFDSNAPVQEVLTPKMDKAIKKYSDLKKKSPDEDSEALVLKASIEADLSDKEFEDLNKYSSKGNKYNAKVGNR